MFDYELVTAGEHLCSHLYRQMVHEPFWANAQSSHFTVTRRSAAFRFFIQEAMAINMAARLIVAAEDVAKQIDPTAPGFLAYTESIIRDWDLETMDNSFQSYDTFSLYVGLLPSGVVNSNFPGRKPTMIAVGIVLR